VVVRQSPSGNPYNEHTLCSALEQVKKLTRREPGQMVVDPSYRGATVPVGVTLYHRKLKRGIGARAQAGHPATQLHRTVHPHRKRWAPARTFPKIAVNSLQLSK
jgi:hypothetical protein